MPHTAFINAAEQQLKQSYKESPAHYESFLERIEEKLAGHQGALDAETRDQLDALKTRLLDKKAADTAPIIGGSFASMG